MANIKTDEMAILKAVSIKLDDETVFINTLQYHTEKGDRDGQLRCDRSKSRYRWLGRVCKIADVRAKIAEFKQDANKLLPWMWPNDPSWNGKILYTDSDQTHAGSWLRSKLNKMVDWDLGVKLLDGYDKKHDEYSVAKKYDTENYMTEDGTPISIKDKTALLARVGQNVWKEMVKKAKTPATQVQPNKNATANADSLTNSEQVQPIEQPIEASAEATAETAVA